MNTKYVDYNTINNLFEEAFWSTFYQELNSLNSLFLIIENVRYKFFGNRLIINNYDIKNVISEGRLMDYKSGIIYFYTN